MSETFLSDSEQLTNFGEEFPVRIDPEEALTENTQTHIQLLAVESQKIQEESKVNLSETSREMPSEVLVYQTLQAFRAVSSSRVLSIPSNISRSGTLEFTPGSYGRANYTWLNYPCMTPSDKNRYEWVPPEYPEWVQPTCSPCEVVTTITGRERPVHMRCGLCRDLSRECDWGTGKPCRRCRNLRLHCNITAGFRQHTTNVATFDIRNYPRDASVGPRLVAAFAEIWGVPVSAEIVGSAFYLGPTDGEHSS